MIRKANASVIPMPSQVKIFGEKNVEGVEGVEGFPKYEWIEEDGHAHNFAGLGRLLESLPLGLYSHPDGGLVKVDGDTVQRISNARELRPLLVDTVKILVFKKGKYKGEHPNESTLNAMLCTESFLDNFKLAAHVTTTPVVLEDSTLAESGWNDGDVLYIGSHTTAESLDCINEFLDVMPFDGNASRTNALAAMLTIPFRFRFPGGKPLVLVTATKSHSGKGTLVNFLKGRCPKAEIAYEATDWPMQRQLHDQLQQAPDIGVVLFDNVRTDSSGRGKIIRSAFLESFITNDEIILATPGRNRPLRTENSFVVMLNSNEGSLSPDLLNRSLPIHLTPKGDLQERVAKTKETLGGDIKHEWLPAHQTQIEAEMLGMIERWINEGQPLDKNVQHPMGPWAQTIGGILKVNGFHDFLANYGATRATADPVKEALAILAFRSNGKKMRAREFAQLAIREGLGKTLMPGVEQSNLYACERAIGVAVKPYVGETLTASTAAEEIVYELRKEQGRFDNMHPHFRYSFVETSRRPLGEDEEPSGAVLEERTTAIHLQDTLHEILEQDLETLSEGEEA